MNFLLVVLVVFGVVGASPTGERQNLGDTPLYVGGHFQGDIVGYDPDDRHAIVDASLLWPGGLLYYELDESVEVIRSYILEGMNDYEEKTCIRFQERTEENKDYVKDYVKIFWWQGCSSLVGRVGGQQYMSLGTGCHWKGLVVHELGHALGFYHEQQRSDRDDYIEIIWDNIMEGLEDQFTVMNVWESNPLGEHFDYDSIMLYEETAFSKDGVAATIKPKQEGVKLIPVWKKEGLSASDVRRVNRLYQCFGEVRPDPPNVPDYLCDFEHDDCGIINQENMGSYFARREETLGGRKSKVLVMQNVDVVSGIGGRLITPHFKNFGRAQACLSFDYFMDGPGTYYLHVSLQSRDTYEVANYQDSSPNWRTFKKTITHDEMDPRMFITASHHGKDSDFVFAIDNVSFTLQPCDQESM